jgi:hypothetical protein
LFATFATSLPFFTIKVSVTGFTHAFVGVPAADMLGNLIP